MGGKTSKLSTSNIFYDRGAGYERQGSLLQAMVDYTEAINLNPKSVMALEKRGLLYMRMRTYDKASIDFSEILKMQPKNLSALKNRIEAYLHQAQFSLVLIDIQTMISINSLFFFPYFIRGLLLFSQEKYAAAAIDFCIAADSYPHHVTLKYRGIVYQKLGEHDKAILDLEKVIELAPTSHEAFIYLGNALQAKQQFSRAIQMYTNAINLDEHCAEALYNRAEVYQLSGLWKKAIQDYTKAIRLDALGVNRFDTTNLTYFHRHFPKFYQILKKSLTFRQRVSVFYQPEDIPADFEELQDPVTYELMNDPIAFTSTGHTYDRSTIANWFIANGNLESIRCPLSNKIITKDEFKGAATHILTKNRIELLLSQLEATVLVSTECVVEDDEKNSVSVANASEISPNTQILAIVTQTRDEHSKQAWLDRIQAQAKKASYEQSGRVINSIKIACKA